MLCSGSQLTVRFVMIKYLESIDLIQIAHQIKPMRSNAIITIVIADDHELLRAGIRTILSREAGLRVSGEAENGDQVKEIVARLRPRILLLDLKMPDTSPAELERWVRTNYPETITLVLTAHDRDTYLANMVDAGAAGYISKNESSERLVAAIRRAASGEVHFSDEQLERLQKWRGTIGKKWDSLTNREKVVLKRLAEGSNNKEIADTLGVTVKTIEYHIGNILKKLELKSRQAAIIWLHENNLDES